MEVGNIMKIALCVFLTAVVVTDLRHYKIKNWMLLIGLILCLVYRAVQGEFFYGLISMMIPFVCFFPFFLLRAFGAGDIKLMCVLATVMTVKETFLFMVASILFGGVIAIMKGLVSGSFKERFCYLKEYLLHCFYSKNLLPYELQTAKEEAANKRAVHFSIPIACAALTWMSGMVF